MAKSPSKPMNIGSPRQTPDEFFSASVSGRQGSMPGPGFSTPSSRPARQGTPSTPPIANIPLRNTDGSPATGGLPASFSTRLRTPHSDGSTTPALGDSPSRALLDDVTEEEMARVLRRHLVPRRAPEVGADIGPEETYDGSRRGSGSGSQTSIPSAQETSGDQVEQEPFPIPYDAPGGDIT